MTRVFVTGANGFVGCELVRQLVSEGHDVCALDSLRSGPWRFDSEGLLLSDADIRFVEPIEEVVAVFKPSVVIHLAAIHFIPECETNAQLAVATNVSGLVNVLEACRAAKVKRFVFASSAAVYAPANGPHDEDGPLGAMDIYGLSKDQGEAYVRYCAEAAGLQAVIVRLFNVVGPGETNPHVVPDIIAQMQAGWTRIRLGNTWPKRDYIDVADAAAGFRAVALREPVNGPYCATVNLGTGLQYSVEELVQKLARITGLPLTIDNQAHRARPVDRPSLVANMHRMQELFGWKPERTVDDALRRLWVQPDFGDVLRRHYANLYTKGLA